MSVAKKVSSVEIKFLLWAHSKTANKKFAKTVRNVSHLGDGLLYFVIASVAYLFGGEAGKLFFWVALSAYALEMSLYFILKNTIKRPRPNGLDGLNALIKPSDTFSFPSGHTAGAFVYATIASFFVPIIAPFAYLVALCIGFSRVVLGVHYPTDIAAGAVLGLSTALFMLAVFGII